MSNDPNMRAAVILLSRRAPTPRSGRRSQFGSFNYLPPPEVGGVEADWHERFVVEWGVEIISEASRYLPDELKARPPKIPWQKVAGIGNVLRWRSHGRFPPLERVCRVEPDTGQAREQDSEGKPLPSLMRPLKGFGLDPF
jgi:hypothetical protein